MSVVRRLASKMPQVLAVFDFDHTVIKENSDVLLRNLLPKEELKKEKLVGLRHTWTSYMAEVFRLLPQHGFTPAMIQETCQKMEAVEGMIELFHYLKEIKADIIIASDANSEIISVWLQHNLPNFSIQVFTNPAVWSEDVLRVKSYHQQTACKMCPVNLCKGSVLRKYLVTRTYDKIIYTGDGRNDLCPSSILSNTDLVFPRRDFKLDQILQTTSIEASVHVWDSGFDIKQIIEKAMDEMDK